LSRLRPRLRLRAEAAALVLATLAVSADALAWDPDEVRDVRVAREAAGVRISWVPPESGADTYVVRRCAIGSLRVPFYGACIAEGLMVAQHDDPSPTGDVFYLVAGVVAGTEGTLGDTDNGVNPRQRHADPCGTLPQPTLWVRVRLNERVEFCGTQVRVAFPGGVVTFVDGLCFDLTSGWFGQSNEVEPGVVIHACADSTAVTGPGDRDITRLEFTQGECPLSAASMRLLSCLVTDCDGNSHEADCTLR